MRSFRLSSSHRPRRKRRAFLRPPHLRLQAEMVCIRSDFPGARSKVSGLLRARSHKIAAAVVAVASTLVGFLPLFGGPGYEHALASGLLVPSAAAIAMALDGSTPDGDGVWRS